MPEDIEITSINPAKQDITELDDKELERYKVLYQKVHHTTIKVSKTLETIGRIHEYINSIVSVRNLLYIRRKTMVY